MTKTAWITGAGKGIGRALALSLSRQGYRVVVSARTPGDLATLAAEAEEHGGTIFPYPLDVTDADAVAEVLEGIERDLGGLDLAVLNAGTHSEVTATDFDLSAFRKVMDTNLMGTANCLAAVLTPMSARGHGQIAIVASVAGYRGLPTAAAYSASKAALIALAEALKPELEGSGIVMTLVNPGFVDTPLTRKNKFPMPFLMKPADAARLIVKGLERRRFEIVFPWQMTVLMKLLGVLPYPLFFAVTRRMLRR